MKKIFLLPLILILNSCAHLKQDVQRKPNQETVTQETAVQETATQVAPPQDVSAASKKPFRTALVISGENINTPLFVGMIDGLIASGKVPDLIVSSCGSSIATALYQSTPDKDLRIQFLTSEVYYNLLRNLNFDDPSLFQLTPKLLKIIKNASQQKKIAKTDKRWVPDIFNYSLLRLEPDFFGVPELNFEQTIKPQATRIILLAARVDYTPAEAGTFVSAERKLFTQTFFTDPDTAKYLAHFPALAPTLDANTSLAAESVTVTDATLSEAVRASISDPFLLNTVKLRDQYYLTGGVNIDPIDVAQSLAEEVISKYPKLYNSTIEQPALMSTFAFDGNMIRKEMISRNVDYWIDDSTKFPDFGLGLHPNFKGALKKVNPGRILKFGSKIPKKYENFVKLVKEQYQFGFDRAQEAISAGRFDRTHIRARFETVGEEIPNKSPYDVSETEATTETQQQQPENPTGPQQSEQPQVEPQQPQTEQQQ